MPANRFVILADVHLGLQGSQPDGLTYGDVSALLPRAVERVVQLDPQNVVLLGDLVNRGYEHEYVSARSALAPIWNRCIPVVGNHELQRASIADFERNMSTRAVRTASINGFAATILNSGIENLPDSEWHGQLDAGQLEFLDRSISKLGSVPHLIFVHHPIAGTVRDSEKPMHGLVNSPEVEQRLTLRPGPTVVFSAHTHSQSFARRGRFSYVGAPPLGFWPHAFVVVDAKPRHMRFSTIRLIDDPSDSPDARAGEPDYRAAREGEISDQTGIIPLEA